MYISKEKSAFTVDELKLELQKADLQKMQRIYAKKLVQLRWKYKSS